MSATEIIAELPKLTSEERQAVARGLRELQEADEGQFLHEAAVEMFRDMDQREAENARCKPGEVWQTDLGMQAKVRPCPLP